MADESSGLARDVRRRLDAGVPPEDVIQELIGRGLSRPTAEHFVDRALAARSSLSAQPMEPAASVPWKMVLIVAGLLVAIGLGAIGYFTWRETERQRQAREAAAAEELAKADRVRADQIRAESAAQREAANRERETRHDARVDEALRQLSSKQPMTQCEAALMIGRIGSKEHVPPLVAMLQTSTYNSVRGCAASALVQLGETETAMNAYKEWINGPDDQLRRSALMGFGEIGPRAADVALPYLTEALKSPHKDLRYLAVESLSKLGPAGVPLLEVASGDADKDVRERAAQILRSRSAR